MIAGLPQGKEFSELTALVKNGDIVVFVGSGLSSRYTREDLSGYPSWPDLVDDLCKRCKVSYEPGEVLTKTTTPERLQILAGMAKKADIAGYVQVIQDHFAKTIVDRKEYYDLLMQIDFHAYVTTNYDPLLAQAAVRTASSPREVCAYPRLHCGDIALRRVVYLHGYVEENGKADPEALILTKDDFDFAYGEEAGGLLLPCWVSLLKDHNVLFLGCELGETELAVCFKRCNRLRKAMRKRFNVCPKKRFILLPEIEEQTFDDSVDSGARLNMASKRHATIQRLSEFDVAPIMYDPRDKRHVGLVEILRDWAPPRPAPMLVAD